MVAYRNFGGDDHAAGLDYDGDFILVDASGGGELFLQGGGVGVVVRAAARSHREHHGIQAGPKAPPRRFQLSLCEDP